MQGWRSLVVVGVFVALSASLSAQWPDHRRANVPRLPDGKVDMNGPTPRTADGKPDLSGTWMNVNRPANQPRLGPAWIGWLRGLTNGQLGGLP